MFGEAQLNRGRRKSVRGEGRGRDVMGRSKKKKSGKVLDVLNRRYKK